MRCSYPQKRWLNGELITYPCGKCNACLKNKQNEKALRGYLESLSHSSSVFLTVTYSDEFLPRNNKNLLTLDKSEFDNFVKRFRAWYGIPVRVLASGEYSKVGRPHYHCCFFGVDVDTFLKGTTHYHKNSSGYILEDFCCWKLGGCMVAPFSIKTSFYVSKYLVKSTNDKKLAVENGIEPEFIYQSRRPALGKAYAIEHRNRLLNDGFIRCKGQKFKIPRYFMDNILNDGTDEFQSFKERLSDKANENFGKYINSLNKQFKGSGKTIHEQIAEEASAREKTLMKGK